MLPHLKRHHRCLFDAGHALMSCLPCFDWSEEDGLCQQGPGILTAVQRAGTLSPPLVSPSLPHPSMPSRLQNANTQRSSRHRTDPVSFPVAGCSISFLCPSYHKQVDLRKCLACAHQACLMESFLFRTGITLRLPLAVDSGASRLEQVAQISKLSVPMLGHCTRYCRCQTLMRLSTSLTSDFSSDYVEGRLCPVIDVGHCQQHFSQLTACK